ncbi:BadM/Rrf2 family transcriptional regulator [Hydrogenispora ethanolica]|uniref:BadM/Rrf2 family transcriptional regulator n=1 Tax=Hydrogenispora ethanolica TaxID=1082276 RepID=A0A4R1RTH6_HYDET|nr:Rrf2 family transcriptional regulator [Hydrogenispora ethanolica]TCL69370.1 BadM/Rrf2 family transcriptional regulator [Hydrogenispora ethanolica]
MKISTRGQYGIRAMLELALHNQDGPVTLKTIAEKQQISEPYLEQLIAALRKSGLVTSVRGALGGYNLTRDPAEIKIGDILRVLEGPIAPVECVAEDSEADVCRLSGHCATRILWQRLRDSMVEVLDSTTLADLINDYHSLHGSNPMYYI